MKDIGIDDLDVLDFFPESSETDIMEELEEYEPRVPKTLVPVDDFSFLVPSGEKAASDHAYYPIVKDPEEALSLFDELLDELKTKPKPKLEPKLPERVERKRDTITPEMRIFLTHYMGSGTITGALRGSKTSLVRYKKWLETSPKFAQAVADSTDALADTLEAEALKQALSGNTKVLLKSLEALRPGKWGKSSTVNTFLDGRLKVEVTNWAELSQKAEVVDIVPVEELGDD